MKKRAIKLSVEAINQLRKRSNQFVNGLNKHIETVVNGNEEIEQLNRDQLKQSKLANDQSISPDYSSSYAAWKRQYYASSYGDGSVNLYLTGALYERMALKVSGSRYIIHSPVPYIAKLYKKYSDKIFGIAPSNQQKAQQIVALELKRLYEKEVL